MSTLSYLFAAYTAIWILLFWYLFTLSRRHRQLEREVAELRQRVERGRE